MIQHKISHNKHSPNEGQGVDRSLKMSEVEVDPNHIRPPELKSEPNIDLNKAFEEFQDISFNADMIKNMANRDEVFLRRFKLRQVANTAEGIEGYIKEGLKNFADRITKRRILQGEPTSEEHYQTLSRMAKHIAAALDRCDEMTRHDTIAALGLAGHYCGSGYFREIQARYQSLVDFESETLKGKVHAAMRNLRDRIFENLIDQFGQGIDSKGKPLDVEDIHVTNQLASILAPDFGLTLDYGASADHGANDDPLSELVFLGIRTFLNRYLPDFWKPDSKYTVEEICKWFNDQLQSGGTIPYKEVENWFVDWLKDKKNLTHDKARNFFGANVLIDEYDDALDVAYIEIKQGYLLAMLVEMGVLKLKKSES